jgi:hypothetical protein
MVPNSIGAEPGNHLLLHKTSLMKPKAIILGASMDYIPQQFHIMVSPPTSTSC